jgi:hypothetical protein
MTRRTIGLLVTLILAILVAPRAVESQPPDLRWRLGFLSGEPPSDLGGSRPIVSVPPRCEARWWSAGSAR